MKFMEFSDFDIFDSTFSEESILKKFQIFGAHEDLCHRLKKTLYYGHLPKSRPSSLPLTEVAVELFGKSVPKGKLGIVNSDFVSSVSRKAFISPCSLMLALVYLERLRHKNPEYLKTVSSCDLFLVSMMVASKYLFDDGEEEEVFSDEWAHLANMDSKDINSLERNFLSAMDWELFVKPETFFKMLQEIETRIAQQEASKRGWLTYTDIHVLSGEVLLLHFLKLLYEDVLKVVLVSAFAYVSALATLATALTLSLHCTILVTEPLKSSNQILTINHLNLSLNHLLLPTFSTLRNDFPPNLDELDRNCGENAMPNSACHLFNDTASGEEFKKISDPYNVYRGLESYITFSNFSNNWASFVTIVRTVFEGISVTRGQKEEFRDNFKYLPTCCSGVNSYFL